MRVPRSEASHFSDIAGAVLAPSAMAVKMPRSMAAFSAALFSNARMVSKMAAGVGGGEGELAISKIVPRRYTESCLAFVTSVCRSRWNSFSRIRCR